MIGRVAGLVSGVTALALRRARVSGAVTPRFSSTVQHYSNASTAQHYEAMINRVSIIFRCITY